MTWLVDGSSSKTLLCVVVYVMRVPTVIYWRFFILQEITYMENENGKFPGIIISVMSTKMIVGLALPMNLRTFIGLHIT